MEAEPFSLTLWEDTFLKIITKTEAILKSLAFSASYSAHLCFGWPLCLGQGFPEREHTRAAKSPSSAKQVLGEGMKLMRGKRCKCLSEVEVTPKARKLPDFLYWGRGDYFQAKFLFFILTQLIGLEV